MAKKVSLSPYTLKTIKRAKVNGVKCYLKAYQTKSVNPVSLKEQPFMVFYYEVSASDGSYQKTTNEQHAHELYDYLLEFQKRQLFISL